VKDVLTQQYCLRTRGKWVSKIQEYDLEIKPTKLIKWKGLAHTLTESNEEVIQFGKGEQINLIVTYLEHDEWYSDILYYLNNISCPGHLVDHKNTALKLKVMNYCLTQDGFG